MLIGGAIPGPGGIPLGANPPLIGLIGGAGLRPGGKGGPPGRLIPQRPPIPPKRAKNGLFYYSSKALR